LHLHRAKLEGSARTGRGRGGGARTTLHWRRFCRFVFSQPPRTAQRRPSRSNLVLPCHPPHLAPQPPLLAPTPSSRMIEPAPSRHDPPATNHEPTRYRASNRPCGPCVLLFAVPPNTRSPRRAALPRPLCPPAKRTESPWWSVPRPRSRWGQGSPASHVVPGARDLVATSLDCVFGSG